MSAAIRTVQPARRMRAASTKSWLRIWPPNGGFPGSVGQSGRFGERAPADDRVVPPVISLRARPPGEPGGDDRAIDATGELLQARERGSAVNQSRHGLDQPGVRICLHAPRELDDALRLHQAVGIEDEQIVVGAAPAPAEIGDVAGLASDVAATAAIVDGRRLAKPRPHLDQRRLLGKCDRRICRVAQDEPVEGLVLAERADARCHRLDRREDAFRAFVVGRHQHGRASPQGSGRRRRRRGASG